MILLMDEADRGPPPALCIVDVEFVVARGEADELDTESDSEDE